MAGRNCSTVARLRYARVSCGKEFAQSSADARGACGFVMRLNFRLGCGGTFSPLPRSGSSPFAPPHFCSAARVVAQSMSSEHLPADGGTATALLVQWRARWARVEGRLSSALRTPACQLAQARSAAAHRAAREDADAWEAAQPVDGGGPHAWRTSLRAPLDGNVAAAPSMLTLGGAAAQLRRRAELDHAEASDSRHVRGRVRGGQDEQRAELAALREAAAVVVAASPARAGEPLATLAEGLPEWSRRVARSEGVRRRRLDEGEESAAERRNRYLAASLPPAPRRGTRRSAAGVARAVARLLAASAGTAPAAASTDTVLAAITLPEAAAARARAPSVTLSALRAALADGGELLASDLAWQRQLAEAASATAVVPPCTLAGCPALHVQVLADADVRHGKSMGAALAASGLLPARPCGGVGMAAVADAATSPAPPLRVLVRVGGQAWLRLANTGSTALRLCLQPSGSATAAAVFSVGPPSVLRLAPGAAADVAVSAAAGTRCCSEPWHVEVEPPLPRLIAGGDGSCAAFVVVGLPAGLPATSQAGGGAASADELRALRVRLRERMRSEPPALASVPPPLPQPQAAPPSAAAARTISAWLARQRRLADACGGAAHAAASAAREDDNSGTGRAGRFNLIA